MYKKNTDHLHINNTKCITPILPASTLKHKCNKTLPTSTLKHTVCTTKFYQPPHQNTKCTQQNSTNLYIKATPNAETNFLPTSTSVSGKQTLASGRHGY